MPLVNVAFVLLGGFFFALFLRHPISGSMVDHKTSLSRVLTGGLGGMLATLAALQGRYIVLASFLTYITKVGVPEGSLRTGFLLAIMEIETYGLIEMLYAMVPAFVCGGLTTAGVAYLSTHIRFFR